MSVEDFTYRIKKLLAMFGVQVEHSTLYIPHKLYLRLTLTAKHADDIYEYSTTAKEISSLGERYADDVARGLLVRIFNKKLKG